MIALCEYSRLKVFKETKHGYFLEDGDGDEVLLPFRSAPDDLEIDSRIEIFTYLDNQGRMIATTKNPKVELYQFAVLKCTISLTSISTMMTDRLDLRISSASSIGTISNYKKKKR